MASHSYYCSTGTTDEWFRRNNSFQISYFSTKTSFISYPIDLVQIYESSHGSFYFNCMAWRIHVMQTKNKTDAYLIGMKSNPIPIFPISPCPIQKKRDSLNKRSTSFFRISLFLCYFVLYNSFSLRGIIFPEG